MTRHFRFVFFSVIGLATSLVAAEPVSFSRQIRPILSEHCFACHGPDEENREADLRLDERSSAFESGAIVPNSLDDSELWQRVTSDDEDTRMPPPGHKRLDAAELELLRNWIESGGEYEQHWAFVAPKKTTLPIIGLDNPIDAFIQHGVTQAGLRVPAVADKATLIRRVTLDLTGLPPTSEEVARFLNDKSDSAYKTLVDGLLDRVTYGEHMARYWLDLARYADTHGLHLDNERSMWPFRDWVVRAFADNLPFDDFTRWQIAGDLLNNPTQDQLIASGFNRCNVSTGEGGSINEEWIFRYAVDRTSTTAEVWMGLTAGCAVCHDHKFDPISAKEFYSMYAFFHSAADPAMDGNRIDTPPIIKLYSDEDKGRLKEIETQSAKIDDELNTRLADFKYDDPALLETPPSPERTTTIWFEDDFPANAKVQDSGGKTKFVSKSYSAAQIFSGERALERTANGLGQDFYHAGAAPISVPRDASVFVHCYLDKDNPPETIMIQFHTDGWRHRAVWGAEKKIDFGKSGTTEKHLMGDLPETGKWVRLDVPAAKMGLNEQTQITGFAFTQYGGKVTWDQLGIEAVVDKANDEAWSFDVWLKNHVGKQVKLFPNDLQLIVKDKPRENWSDEDRIRIRSAWLKSVSHAGKPIVDEFNSRRKKIQAEKGEIDKAAPITFVMADLPKPRESFVMLRGAYDNKGERVSRNVPAFLPPLPQVEQRDYNRLDLANWLVSDNHPLTARVAVNRFWQQFFGTGLVNTSGDFGSQGEVPSHPELLDWLAVDFAENGWDIKRLVKQIVTSHTYRQSAQVPAESVDKDPLNRLLSHAPRLRLDAEVLRDQALFVSGLMVNTIGGKAVKPYQPPNIWEPVGFGGSNTRFYKQDKGDALYRRSIYTFLKRTAPAPFMSTFDAPNREQSCTRRERSNTPMQALQLMNDIQHVEAARNLAEQMIKNGGDTAADRIRWVWLKLVSREPTELEQQITTQSLKLHQQRYAADKEAAEKLVTYGDSQRDSAIDVAELAAYTMTANLLMNLDEFVTKN
ncbi:MAG: PSD1 and planctomycete cytochrome C domain-containing protein [Planctomycetota bacterium]